MLSWSGYKVITNMWRYKEAIELHVSHKGLSIKQYGFCLSEFIFNERLTNAHCCQSIHFKQVLLH